MAVEAQMKDHEWGMIILVEAPIVSYRGVLYVSLVYCARTVYCSSPSFRGEVGKNMFCDSGFSFLHVRIRQLLYCTVLYFMVVFRAIGCLRADSFVRWQDSCAFVVRCCEVFGCGLSVSGFLLLNCYCACVCVLVLDQFFLSSLI